MRMFYRPALLVAVLGLAASCSNSSTTPSNPGSTGNTDNASVSVPQSDAYGQTVFDPTTVNISAGGQVVFSSMDSVEHHPTADDGSWNQDLPAGGSASQTFKTAGTFTYHCSIHPNMTGKIIVK